MNKQYIVSTMLVISSFGLVGALIPSVISMPVEASVCDYYLPPEVCHPQINCEKFPLWPGCLPQIHIDTPVIPRCGIWCPQIIFDPKLILEHPNWNITISSHQDANSTTLSVTIPNEILDALKTNMETASLQQQNSSMLK